jgi:hypothetical protein
VSHRSRYRNRAIFSPLWVDIVFIFIVIVLIVRGAEVESRKEVELASGVDALCPALDIRYFVGWTSQTTLVGADSGEDLRVFVPPTPTFKFPSQLAIYLTKKSTDLIPPSLLRNKLVANSRRWELVARFSICGEHSTMETWKHFVRSLLVTCDYSTYTFKKANRSTYITRTASERIM